MASEPPRAPGYYNFMCLVQKMSFNCRYPLSLEKCDEHFATSFMDTIIDTFSLTDRLVL